MSPGTFLDPKLFDETVAAVALFAGPEHRLVYQNAASCRLLGARPLGLPAREAFAEPDAAEFMTVLDDVVATGRPRRMAESREPDPGAVEQARYFVYSCTPVTLSGRPGVMVVALDTTAETLALERYQALVSAVSQMVWVLHADGSAEEVVPGWQELTGERWHGGTDEDWYAYIHPRDREALGRAWRAAAAQAPPGVVEGTFRVRTADGSYHHMSTRCVPVLRHGRAEEWVAATVDVEETWRATLHERVLARVAEVAAGSLDEVFAVVARTVVPELADCCVILLLSHEEWPLPRNTTVTARRVASEVRPGLPAAPTLRGESVVVTDAVRELLEGRGPRTFRLIPAGRLPDGLLPAVTERWLIAAGATSLTLVPLVVEGTVLGYAATSTNGDTPVPGPRDVELLREVLHLAQRPIHRVLDLQRARRIALRLQRSHLIEPPAVPGASLAACYQPASSAHEIGGDWYDAIVHRDGTLALDIGDVAGHDLAAATAMGQLRSMCRGLAWNMGPGSEPGAVLAMLDDAADGLAIASFATAVHTHLRQRSDGTWWMAWSNAGHPPPLLVPAEGTPRFLTGTGEDPPLCVDPGIHRTTHTAALAPGDTLLYYTDGLIETPASSLDTGQRRLLQAAARHRGESLPDLLGHLQSLSDARDDVAMIAFRTDPTG
ncbi:SpoIIE family protein phosphatase [Kitasatospora sp. NPDC059646]|uniref:SpoIIE family protein phosphatase n=1 Tax=Kitasatospora sp. NPDC059646 TaxID=3346893 RepID=UPI00369C0042